MLEELKQRGTRLVQLRGKLAGRLGPDRKPLPGYEKNCEDLRKEIERLENLSLTTSTSKHDASAVASPSNEQEPVDPVTRTDTEHDS